MDPTTIRLTRPARAESLVEQIAASLRNAVLDGSLKPGERLRQERLAADLGVSRTPLREAMRKLEEEGFIQILPSKGAQVATLDPTEQAAAYEVREVLDGLAARLASSRIRPEQADELRSVVETMAVQAEGDVPDNWHTANLRFHQIIYEASGNAPLLRMFPQTRMTELANPTTSELYPSRRELSLDEHRTICEAILAGDGERAEATARRHMRSARSALLRRSSGGHGD